MQLGSDCPFFILNKPSLATGRGEVFEEVKVDLSPYKIVIVNPGIHISTPWAFGQLKPAPPQFNLKTSIAQPPHKWKNYIFNDFEDAVFEAFPETAAIKKQLYQAGAIFAIMSGSGSTIYGLFEKTLLYNSTFPNNIS
ncbi:4-(cytidine 5'-diphospho)-2-C-methyl-D-erythritol kinase [Niabella hibiscisoli]|uniref:4-(cytidine 5'-diphospho)-2-C-methyl-D-erythritol kinase n=1 Tax=Niabella hibiscisoli TaxID=1825928 RepID=UPI001F0E84BB|nr:hypothetical protein [Niabella hibiscisoli]MCH5718720.1 hypothetical protein [Niabella hibiscisoli]